MYSNSIPFPCENSTKHGRSQVKPTSVHKLRPGDIDLIAAMGDSLVAGNGALEEWALGTLIENRGVSWCAGKFYICWVLLKDEQTPGVSYFAIVEHPLQCNYAKCIVDGIVRLQHKGCKP